ncbi:uncharacterized protein LOC131257911 isoform X2 [Magnolia sinica]|uniref:uncharacterized protein LOC131257911 isoform X2 n=1 Tax=Magnolia sinica TaxID=86752 RepID=UPI002659A079|nr:uncharacterized protein LOC131257911 isoform X2 [Magnolia sinica]
MGLKSYKALNKYGLPTCEDNLALHSIYAAGNCCCPYCLIRYELTSSFPESEHDSSNQLRDSIDGQKLRETPSVKKIEIADENTTVVKLMVAYEACISSLRKSQASRWVSSLKRISPANSSKESLPIQ